MADEGHWFFCLKHMKVEEGPGCPDGIRMGPYDSEEEARLALNTAEQRNEVWDAQDG